MFCNLSSSSSMSCLLSFDSSGSPPACILLKFPSLAPMLAGISLIWRSSEQIPLHHLGRGDQPILGHLGSLLLSYLQVLSCPAPPCPAPQSKGSLEEGTGSAFCGLTLPSLSQFPCSWWSLPCRFGEGDGHIDFPIIRLLEGRGKEQQSIVFSKEQRQSVEQCKGGVCRDSAPSVDATSLCHWRAWGRGFSSMSLFPLSFGLQPGHTGMVSHPAPWQEALSMQHPEQGTRQLCRRSCSHLGHP